MGLAHPEALLLLPPLLLLVRLLHRRRRVLRRWPIAAPFFLPPAGRFARGGERGWRDRLHLLLRLTIVTLLVVGLAGPWWRGQGPERMVVVVARGLQMALPLTDGRTRFAAALDDAGRALEEAAPARALVLLADSEPEAASSWLPPAQALAAARRLTPGLGRSDPLAALREARRLAGPEGAVVLARAPLHPVPGNRSIVSLSFSPHRGEPGRGVLGVRLRTQQVQGQLLLVLESSSGRLSEARLDVPPTGEVVAAVGYKGPGGSPLRARLAGSDPFPADDEAWIRLPPLGPRKVALVGPGNGELTRALAAIPRVELVQLPPGSRPGAEEAALVVADREPADGWGDADGPPVVLVAPRGPLLALPPAPSGTAEHGEPGAPAAAAVAADVLVAAEEQRAGVVLLAGLDPGRSVRLPEPPPGAKILARRAGGSEPLLWTQEQGRVRVALAFDPGEAGLAGSALHAVLWDDLLDPLLLPPDGGCQVAVVGERLAGGVLQRPGVYELPGDGCTVATLPLAALQDGAAEGTDEEYQALMEAGPAAPAGPAATGAAPAPALDAETVPEGGGPPPAHRRPLAALLALLLLALLAAERAISTAAHRPLRAAGTAGVLAGAATPGGRGGR
ncbi:MAG: hypothetical protein FJ125_02605 [Deltaproteobacteria bacterium]|nr:hypothetical protein [Deltaproteobacteria bacterium]